MKKQLGALALAFALVLPLVSCKNSKDPLEGLEKVNIDTDFNLAESFVIPPTPVAQEYSYTVADIDNESTLPAFVESAFGDGSYGAGETESYTENENTTFTWADRNDRLSASVEHNGYFSYYKGKYSAEYNDVVEQLFGGTLYEPEFASTEITLKNKTAKLSELKFLADSQLRISLDSLGSDMDFSPAYVRKIVSDSGKLLFIDIVYAARVGEGFTRVSFDKDSSFTTDKYADNTYPLFHVFFYTVDEVTGIWQRGGLMKDITAGDRLDIIDCENALKKADEALADDAKTLTLHIARLEYTPFERTGDNSYKLKPMWAFYYTDDLDKNGAVYVDAQSGEVKKIAAGYCDIGDPD